MKKILLITNQGSSQSMQAGRLKNLQQFVDAANIDSEIQYEFCMAQELLFVSKQGVLSVLLRGRELRNDYSALHLRNFTGYSDFANALRLYCEHYSLVLVNQQDVTLPYNGKVSQGFLFSISGVPTPDLVSSPSNKVLQEYLQKHNTYPMIIKHNDGIMGLHNYLVRSANEMEEVLAQSMQGFVAQPFIKNMGELRVLTFGKTLPPFIFRKYATEDSHLNNTSRGGGAEIIDIDTVNPRHLKHALQAAALTHRDVGGVDVLLGEQGRYYILEVNATPAIASGVFSEQKINYYQCYIADLLDISHKQKEA